MERFDVDNDGNIEYCDDGLYVDADTAQSRIAKLEAEVERTRDVLEGQANVIRNLSDLVDTAWNDAIKAAAAILPSCGACGGADAILTLLRDEKP